MLNAGDRPLTKFALRPPRAPHASPGPSPDNASGLNAGDRPLAKFALRPGKTANPDGA